MKAIDTLRTLVTLPEGSEYTDPIDENSSAEVSEGALVLSQTYLKEVLLAWDAMRRIVEGYDRIISDPSQAQIAAWYLDPEFRQTLADKIHVLPDGSFAVLYAVVPL